MLKVCKSSQARRELPKNVNVLASRIVERATSKPATMAAKNPAAVKLGRLGGLKGGKVRAEILTSVRRIEIAKKAAQARWRDLKMKLDKRPLLYITISNMYISQSGDREFKLLMEMEFVA